MSSTQALWRGHSLLSGHIPTPVISRQILWELFEVNFRYELLVLDRACYDLMPEGFDTTNSGETEEGEVRSFDDLDASSFGDRQMRVLGAINHFNSTLIPSDTDDGRNGFASPDGSARREAYAGLYRVMRSWQRVPELSSRTVRAAQRILASGPLDTAALMVTEEGLAYHYVQCYFTVIGRPPLVPHGL